MRTRVHISLPVVDVPRAVAFYEGLFGEPASTLKDDYANFRLDGPALHLALVRGEVGALAEHRHFGVELFDLTDLALLRARVEGAGLEVRVEEQIACCYATADKFWATDPDGHEWEFWVRTGDAAALAPVPAPVEACCAPVGAEAARCC